MGFEQHLFVVHKELIMVRRKRRRKRRTEVDEPGRDERVADEAVSLELCLLMLSRAGDVGCCGRGGGHDDGRD